MHVLVIDGPATLPPGTTDLFGDIGWEVTVAHDYAAAALRAGSGEIEAAILSEPQATIGEPARREFDHLLEFLSSRRIAAVMLSDRAADAGDSAPFLNVVDRHICLAELRGRLTMIERYHRMLTRVEGELHNMQRLTERLHEHFREVDDELQLAARLQRDFLPDLSRPIGNLQFAALYRPASWVSGDMYDVLRIDDDHTGVYIVDAVGHGMAASLLTMFIKRAIVPTLRHGDRQTVLSPSHVIASLNNALADQSLPNCQFVTACYGLFHHPTRRFQYARGGHPNPLCIARGGAINEMPTPGGLLGLAKGEEFPTLETTLSVGDKIVFYTDGFEQCLPLGRPDALIEDRLCDVFAPLAALPIERMIADLEPHLAGQTSFGDLRDDLTLLGLEVLPG